MFIKPTRTTRRDKSCPHYLLVESVRTPQGPRHHVVCSFGALAPTERAKPLSLAHAIESALRGQPALWLDPQVESAVEKLPPPRLRGRPRRPADCPPPGGNVAGA